MLLVVNNMAMLLLRTRSEVFVARLYMMSSFWISDSSSSSIMVRFLFSYISSGQFLVLLKSSDVSGWYELLALAPDEFLWVLDFTSAWGDQVPIFRLIYAGYVYWKELGEIIGIDKFKNIWDLFLLFNF
jgi:hypothetical protein